MSIDIKTHTKFARDLPHLMTIFMDYMAVISL